MMVAETKETMNRMMECWSDGFRAMFDAGRRTQETWFKAMTDASKNPVAFDNFLMTGEKAAREFPPFVGKNMEAFAQACDTTFRGNMDVFKATTEFAAHPEEGDLYQRSRRVFDVAFDAVRNNFDAFNKATTRNAEMCSAFYQAVCTCPEGSRSAAKSGKGNA